MPVVGWLLLDSHVASVHVLQTFQPKAVKGRVVASHVSGGSEHSVHGFAVLFHSDHHGHRRVASHRPAHKGNIPVNVHTVDLSGEFRVASSGAVDV